jgi:DNA-directed RNA polymerase specialized sigma24 family protein
MLLTEKQKTAFRLREREGLNDSQAAERMGLKCRESFNRLYHRAASRVRRLRSACAASGECALVESVLN